MQHKARSLFRRFFARPDSLGRSRRQRPSTPARRPRMLLEQLEDRLTPSSSSSIDLVVGSANLVNKGNPWSPAPIVNGLLVAASTDTLAVQLSGTVPDFTMPMQIGLDDDPFPSSFGGSDPNGASPSGASRAQTSLDMTTSSVNLPSASANAATETSENATSSSAPHGKYEIRLFNWPSTTT